MRARPQLVISGPETVSSPEWAVGNNRPHFCLSVLLAKAGFLSSEEIAAGFERAVEQGAAQAAESGSDIARPSFRVEYSTRSDSDHPLREGAATPFPTFIISQRQL